MAGSDDSWRTVFTSDDDLAITHMDSCSVGDYFAFSFPFSMQMNGFRFECHSSNIEMNVLDIQYYDGSSWVTAGTTNSADMSCTSAETPSYAEWQAGPSSSQWKFVLTEHHGGPWYHGFAWYGAENAGIILRSKCKHFNDIPLCLKITIFF